MTNDRFKRLRLTTAASLAIPVVILSGCNSSSETPAGSGATPRTAAAPVPAGFKPLSDNDPSVISENRLGDINSALLLYYQANQQLPTQLEDLHNVDSDLNLAGPSGQEYAYVPGGLASADGMQFLLVYDPVALPGGRRWGIVAKPFHPGAPLVDTVNPLSDAQFQAFLASAKQH